MTFFLARNYRVGVRAKQQPRADAFNEIVNVLRAHGALLGIYKKLELGLYDTGMLVHMRTTNQLSWVLAAISGFQLQENQ